ncbi:hypothetical protein BST41_22430 [Mycolicibacterium porcinum]|nr:hypothetical protein A5721_20080 [Mycolicibacterium vulneris]ORB37583.1 hypothetical protein BST41_22430 [Mycolicibacterium porcinum]
MGLTGVDAVPSVGQIVDFLVGELYLLAREVQQDGAVGDPLIVGAVPYEPVRLIPRDPEEGHEPIISIAC